MPRVLLDFSDVDPGSAYEPLPRGVYEAVLDTQESEVRSGRVTQTRYIPIRLHVQGDGRTVVVSDTVMIEGRGVWKAGQILNAVGLQVKKGDRNVVFDTVALHGKRVRVALDIEERNVTAEDGSVQVRRRNRVVRYLPANAPNEPQSGSGTMLDGSGTYGVDYDY